MWSIKMRIAIATAAVGALCCVPIAAQTFEVDEKGIVEAEGFVGDGAGLTGVGADLQHGFFNADCLSDTTCFLFTACATNFEVTGGGFFINSTNDAARSMVTLHQTYRATVTQWAIEATNGSGIDLDLFVTSECARVAPGAAEVDQGQELPPSLNSNRTLLACPEWDVARYVARDSAEAAIFCPNHGLQMKASGGGPLPIPLEPDPAVEASASSETASPPSHR